MMQIFLVFFLWDTVFSDPDRIVFGYDRQKILTYVFGILLVRAFVLSARAVDVAGEISRGDLSNYLIKPLNYFKYWITRDLSSKTLNLIFAGGEAILLYLILKPPFFFQTNLISLFGFLVSLILAIFIFFVLLFITSTVAFWVPEASWGTQFLVIAVTTEFLSGAIFPLDIFPGFIQDLLNLTPFPYLIFFPIQVYLGNVTVVALLKGLTISLFWSVILWIGLNSIWNRGLKSYQSSGR